VMGEVMEVAGTVGDAIREARTALEAAGAADPRREAEELYAAVVRRPTSAAWLEREEPMSSPVRMALEVAARRRASGCPPPGNPPQHGEPEPVLGPRDGQLLTGSGREREALGV